jgi:hypothetical protein
MEIVSSTPVSSLALQPPWALASTFQFHDHVIGGRLQHQYLLKR